MYYVYILANVTNEIVYTGVTNNLGRRMIEHKNGAYDGFTKKYHIHKLVFYAEYSEVLDAISKEKQIKGWRREKKDKLINSFNPNWEDLSKGFI